MSDRVRLKCTELLYGWSQVLSHEPKVKEAYDVLKRQGIIKYDPVHIDKVGLVLLFLSLCPSAITRMMMMIMMITSASARPKPTLCLAYLG